jgi:AraC-like DNA-binding protein
VELRGADFLRVRDGAIASVQIYYDSDLAPAVEATNAGGHVSKYSKSGLSESEAPHLHDHLLAVMREERLFLDPDLTLVRLARHLGVSTNHLSQVINSQCQQNFWEFLTRYRVEEAKRMLRDAGPGQAEVLQVALDAGFRSKSSFYTAFKRHTRMTPREYLDAQR